MLTSILSLGAGIDQRLNALDNQLDALVVKRSTSTSVGIGCSGGSLPGIVDSSTVLFHLDKYVGIPSDVQLSSVSGGTFGTLLFEMGVDMDFPTYTPGGPKWTYDAIKNWQPAAGKIPYNAVVRFANWAMANLGAVKSCFKDAALKIGVNALKEGTPVAPIEQMIQLFIYTMKAQFGEVLSEKLSETSFVKELAAPVDKTVDEQGGATCPAEKVGYFVNTLECLLDKRPLWVCGGWLMFNQWGLEYETTPTHGRHDWEVQFSVYDHKPPAGHGLSYPMVSVYNSAEVSKYFLSLSSLNVKTGAVTTSPYFHKATGKMYSVEKSQRIDIDVRYAAPFSSSFINMGTGFLDNTTAKPLCGLKTVGAMLEKLKPVPMKTELSRAIYNQGFGIELVGDNGEVHEGTCTDGGDTETLALFPLLRKQIKNVMLVMDGPYQQDGKFQYMWGHAIAGHACDGKTAINAHHHVFPYEMWTNVSRDINTVDNTGVHIYPNVPVADNDILGVTGYTLENLIIVDNYNKTGFESEVLATPYETVSNLTTGFKTAPYPCNGHGNFVNGKQISASNCRTAIKQPVANAISLLFQWKIAQRAEELKAIFHGTSKAT